MEVLFFPFPEINKEGKKKKMRSTNFVTDLIKTRKLSNLKCIAFYISNQIFRIFLQLIAIFLCKNYVYTEGYIYSITNWQPFFYSMQL